MPYGKQHSNGEFLDKKLVTVKEWDTNSIKRGFGIFEIIKTENYEK